MSEHHDGSDSGSEGDDGEADQQRGVHEEAIVPAAAAGSAEHPGKRPRVWPWLLALVLVSAVIASFLVPMPYYVEAPGSVRATQPLVSVTGRDSYDSEGEVFFTTVSERRATPMLLLQAWLDESIDSISEDDLYPKGDRDEQRRVEQLEMDRSKLTSLKVAFGELDIDYTETGTGAFVNEVIEGLPADGVLVAGDVITAIDGSPVTLATDVRPLLDGKAIGDEITVTVRRKGTDTTTDLTFALGRNEQDPSRGFLGVALETADEQLEYPFEVELDSGSVIGPSAGLAWTLGVIDRLSPGDLTHGKHVAVTGTIAEDGTVGPIGGIDKKVVGAKNAGATLFLYPESTAPDDVRRMKELAGDDIVVKPVGTIDDALKVLDPDGLGAD